MPHLPKDESLSAQGPLQCTRALHHMNTLMFGATIIKVKFKKWFVGLSNCFFFAPRAGSLDEVWMLLHHYETLWNLCNFMQLYATLYPLCNFIQLYAT
jgi:hypothetical protein